MSAARAQEASSREAGIDESGPDRALQARASRTRLLFVVDRLEANHAGRMLVGASVLLQGEGFDVAVVGLGPWGAVADSLEDRGIHVSALGPAGPWDPRSIGRFLSLLRRDRIQIVHALSGRAGFVARTLARLGEVPVVVTSLHGGDLSGPWRRRVLENLVAPLADAVVVPSEIVRRSALRRHGVRPGQVRLLRAGVAEGAFTVSGAARETARRDLGAGSQDRLVGVVGGLREPRRGLSVFLAAARLLAQEIPSARFAIVGEGPDRRRLEARAAEEGVSYRTLFAGWPRDLEAAMASLDLLVLPAQRPASSLAALAAMAAGTPIVATRTGDLPEIIADGATGLLVPPGDAPALARACASLLRDRDRAARMADAARQRALQIYRLERMAEGLAELYRELMRPAAGRASAGLQFVSRA